VNFFAFSCCNTHFKSEPAPKWLKIDQDNLQMKFLASNADFSSLSPDPLSSRRPVHASVKKGHSFKKWLFH